jgi:hypothetical protein
MGKRNAYPEDEGHVVLVDVVAGVDVYHGDIFFEKRKADELEAKISLAGT